MARFSYQILSVAPSAADLGGVSWNRAGWQPRIDIYRGAAAIWVQVEAPGLDESRLRLHFEPGQLSIAGERARPELPDGARCLQMEIEYGRFERLISLPSEADGDRISAEYQAGILLVTIPLRPLQPPSSVRVSIA